MSESKGDIDESLYSRQLYTVGKEAMLRMSNYTVLISGLGGAGAEIAKNAILAGMKTVDLHDDTPAQWSDLSSNFYLTEEDVKKKEPRAEATLSKFRQLNSYVNVKRVSGELSEEVIRNYSMVVLVNYSQEDIERFDQMCSKNNVHVIATGSYGLFGYAFCNYGKGFEVNDPDGEDPQLGLMHGVSNEKQALVTIEENLRHGLHNGDLVQFHNVVGMEELNKLGPVKVTVETSNSFRVDVDTTSFGNFKGGYYTQVKTKSVIDFKSFAEALKEPELCMTNVVNFDRPANLHAVMQAVWEHEKTAGALPTQSDAEKVIETARRIKGCDKFEGSKNEEDDLKRLVATSTGNLNPVACVFGGVVGQEIMKAASGKFTPITQWYYYDAADALSAIPEAEDLKPENGRYDGQIAVFGRKFQAELASLKYFIVGSGALGCEFLKNFALMGIACGENGHIFITDNDSIEKSNLNRQFLFRDSDVGQPKSSTAAKAVKAMNRKSNHTIQLFHLFISFCDCSCH